MASGMPNSKQGPAEASTGQSGQPAAEGPAGQEGDLGEEERLEKALKTLKEMHIQLRGLRTTIPRMIAPLTSKQPSPETLFREFSNSANTANQEVQEFRRLMTDKESAKVLEQAQKSRTDNPKGIKPWRVSEHPDWLVRDT